jgi:hypothetical protein
MQDTEAEVDFDHLGGVKEEMGISGGELKDVGSSVFRRNMNGLSWVIMVEPEDPSI